MELCELIAFAKDFASLGDSIQEQVQNVIDGDIDDCSPAALKMIKSRLGGFNTELDELLSEIDD